MGIKSAKHSGISYLGFNRHADPNFLHEERMLPPRNNVAQLQQGGVGGLEEVELARAKAKNLYLKDVSNNSSDDTATAAESEYEYEAESDIENDAEDLEKVDRASDDVNLVGPEHVDFSAFRGKPTLITGDAGGALREFYLDTGAPTGRRVETGGRVLGFALHFDI